MQRPGSKAQVSNSGLIVSIPSLGKLIKLGEGSLPSPYLTSI